MKVLMFGWEFPPFNSGGLGTACYGLTKALSEQGVEVLFVLPKKVEVKSDFMKILFADIPNVHFKEFNSLLYPYITSAKYKRLLAESGEDSIFASELVQEVIRYGEFVSDFAKDYDFDIIHAHDWLSFMAGVRAKRISMKPLISHIHATEFDRSGENINKGIYRVEKYGVEKSDAVLTVSELTKHSIEDHYSINPKKIEVIYNGIDASEFENDDKFDDSLRELKTQGYKIVLFLGRITMQKGPEYFIRAARKVIDYMPNTIFIMAGSGDMEEVAMMEAASLGIGDKVLFTGFVRGKDRTKLYRAADLFVLPSVSEPFGLVTLEALVNKTPVLISKQSGVSEALNHALKVDFWDVDEMANKIVSVLEHPSLQYELTTNGEKEAKSMTWEKSAKKVVKLYTKLTGKSESSKT